MNRNVIKKILLAIGFILILGFLYLYFIRGGIGSPSIKKSNYGICHEKGTLFYKNTENFTSYKSIEDCLNSGGRLPKN